MKLISWNVNGIKSRYNDGRINQIFELNPDIFCLQELKQKTSTFNNEQWHKDNYYDYLYPTTAEHDNWGVGTYTKIKPLFYEQGLNEAEYDRQARIQQIEFEEFNLYNIYAPSEGNSGLEFKCKFFELVTQYVLKSKKPQIICGDFNRIYTLEDTYQSTYAGAGYRKEDKEWFKKFLEKGFIDTFRLNNKEEGNYTYWHSKEKKKENEGYRFDYFFVSEELKDNVVEATILKDFVTHDHAPIMLEIEF